MHVKGEFLQGLLSVIDHDKETGVCRFLDCLFQSPVASPHFQTQCPMLIPPAFHLVLSGGKNKQAAVAGKTIMQAAPTTVLLAARAAADLVRYAYSRRFWRALALWMG